MNIAIVGAGVTGVTLAYTLIADQHSVHVFEQRQTVAEEASYACGGLLSAGWPSPLAAPGMAWDLLYPGSSSTAIRLGQWIRPADAPWLLRWWMQINKKTHAARQSAALALTQLSQEELNRTQAELKLDYENTEGLTVLVRSGHDRERLAPYLKWLTEAAIPHQMGGADLALTHEPALNPQTPLHTAIPEATSPVKQKAEPSKSTAHFRHEIHPTERRKKTWTCPIRRADEGCYDNNIYP